jgi:hypothetical protein
MTSTSKECEHGSVQKPNWYRIGTWGAVVIIAYFLVTEHLAHTIQALPYLLLLACPLMHFFMHGKHHDDHHGSHGHHKEKENQS